MKCLNCGIEKETNKSFQKFCSIKCKLQFNSKLQYKRIKEDPKKLIERGKKFDIWRKKNKEKWNAQMRIIALKSQKKIRYKRKLKNLCPKCGNERDDSKYLQCSECREKHRNYLKIAL